MTEDDAGPVRRRYRAVLRWVLVTGDRRLVTLLFVLTGFLVVGPGGHELLPYPVRPTGTDHTTVPLVSTMLSGTFFLFSIVVSVNSLYVSQQQNPLGRQFGRVQSVVEFRRSLEEVLDAAHVPAEPERLVRLLSGEILARANRLQSELRTADFDLREDLETYVDSLAHETGEMNGHLESAGSSTDVVVATMDYNHDRQINDLRRLRTDHAEDLSGDADDAIGEMLRLLQYFATAREYLKTIYTREEFASLSTDLVAVSLPAIAVVAGFLHYLHRLPDNHLFVAAVEAVGFAPFLLVAAYVLRVATISRGSHAAGQFVVGDRARGDITGIRKEDD